MATRARRMSFVRGSRAGLTTLEQRFRFEGEHADPEAIVRVLSTAALVGDDSIFGSRPGREGDAMEAVRTLHGFSPAPGFRFDVRMERRGDGQFIVSFQQPDEKTPYLEGDLLWTVAADDGGAVLDEQINTETALGEVSRPLSGPRPSVRRWLFFRAGHKQVMAGATKSLARLLDSG